MKATEFAYWLQGYFEILGEDTSLTKAQADQVLKKISAVTLGVTDVEVKAHTFVTYAKGALDAATGDLSLRIATDNLKSQLHELFVHAIDPSYQGDQQTFNNTHGGGFNHGPGMRC